MLVDVAGGRDSSCPPSVQTAFRKRELECDLYFSVSLRLCFSKPPVSERKKPPTTKPKHCQGAKQGWVECLRNTGLVNWNAVLPAASCSFGVPGLPLPHLAEFLLCSFLPSLCVLFSPSLAPGSPVLCQCCVKPRGFGKAGLPGGAGAFGVRHSPYCQGNAEGPLCAAMVVDG